MRTGWWLLAMSVAVLFPRGLNAQAPICGDYYDPDEDPYEFAERIFFDMDEGYVQIRQHLGISDVDVNTPRSIVTDEAQCSALMSVVVADLQSRSDWPKIQQRGYRHRIVRFGPYDVVLIMENPPPGIVVDGWAPAYFFLSDGPQFLGIVMV